MKNDGRGKLWFMLHIKWKVKNEESCNCIFLPSETLMLLFAVLVLFCHLSENNLLFIFNQRRTPAFGAICYEISSVFLEHEM
jgi:hypothetical protein